jgi:hypothetical protein
MGAVRMTRPPIRVATHPRRHGSPVHGHHRFRRIDGCNGRRLQRFGRERPMAARLQPLVALAATANGAAGSVPGTAATQGPRGGARGARWRRVGALPALARGGAVGGRWRRRPPGARAPPTRRATRRSTLRAVPRAEDGRRRRATRGGGLSRGRLPVRVRERIGRRGPVLARTRAPAPPVAGQKATERSCARAGQSFSQALSGLGRERPRGRSRRALRRGG